MLNDDRALDSLLSHNQARRTLYAPYTLGAVSELDRGIGIYNQARHLLSEEGVQP